MSSSYKIVFEIKKKWIENMRNNNGGRLQITYDCMTLEEKLFSGYPRDLTSESWLVEREPKEFE